MNKNGNYFDLPAVKGIQAGRSYYVAMCPLGVAAKLFQYDDNTLPTEMRAQRILNKQRIPEMKDYIINNRSTYVFSSLTISIDGDIIFCSDEDTSYGRLKIPIDARILINDGQHRKAAIEVALAECPELKYEDISVVIYHDLGLKRSQQMFTDLNRYAIRPTKSLNLYFDNRSKDALMIKTCIEYIPMFKGSVEYEKASISNRSKALFTLSGIYFSTRELVKGLAFDEECTKDIIINYWNAVSSNMIYWNKAKEREISPDEFRKNYICAHAVTLKALGLIGFKLIENYPNSECWKDRLQFLKELDWAKNNLDLSGIVMVNGRISASHNSVKEFASYLIKKSGWFITTGETL